MTLTPSEASRHALLRPWMLTYGVDLCENMFCCFVPKDIVVQRISWSRN